MRKVLFLPSFPLLFACADGTPLQPDLQEGQRLLSVAQSPGPDGGWSFQTDAVLVGPVEPGTTRATPSGVMHIDGVVNESAMTGDLNGSWFFIDKFHAFSKQARGRSIPSPVLIVITESDLGSGIFECAGSFKFENYPDFETFIQYGNVSGCHGTGDFAGMRMKAYLTNEADPGLGFVTTYDFSGKIW